MLDADAVTDVRIVTVIEAEIPTSGFVARSAAARSTERPLVLSCCATRRVRCGADVEARRRARRQAARRRHGGLVLGRPAIVRAQGEFQLVITRMLPTAAVGAAQQELERIEAVLQKDGLFVRLGSVRFLRTPPRSPS